MGKRRHLYTAAIIVAGLIFIAVGAARGEALTILRKATVICLECMGIG